LNAASKPSPISKGVLHFLLIALPGLKLCQHLDHSS
jgi:hypothetical protein